jgi:hypothetical protein
VLLFRTGTQTQRGRQCPPGKIQAKASGEYFIAAAF